MKNVNQAEFWQQRYETGSIQWDMGQVSPPLKAYIDQLPATAKNQAILVPGLAMLMRWVICMSKALPM